MTETTPDNGIEPQPVEFDHLITTTSAHLPGPWVFGYLGGTDTLAWLNPDTGDIVPLGLARAVRGGGASPGAVMTRDAVLGAVADAVDAVPISTNLDPGDALAAFNSVRDILVTAGVLP